MKKIKSAINDRVAVIFLLFLIFFIFGCQGKDIDVYKANKLSAKSDIPSLLEARKIYLQYASNDIVAKEGLKNVCKQIGIYYTVSENFTEAIEYLSESIALDPTQYIVHYYLGISYANLYAKEPIANLKALYKEKALYHYQQTLTIMPSFTSGIYALGYFYFSVEKDYPKAKELLLMTLSREPKHIHALMVMAQLAYAEGDKMKTLDYYTEVLNYLPKNDSRKAAILDNMKRIKNEISPE